MQSQVTYFLRLELFIAWTVNARTRDGNLNSESAILNPDSAGFLIINQEFESAISVPILVKNPKTLLLGEKI